MLKRQRPSSPPPSSPSVPLMDMDNLTLTERHMKRRRTLPPMLDGPSRGWAQPPNHDDSEEYIEWPANEGQYDPTPSLDSPEYKSVNNVLRDLHTLHQHRCLMSNTIHSAPSFDTLYNSLDSSSHLSRSERSAMHSKECSQLGREVHMPDEELHRVKERYAHANKLLGSLFLSRRRELGSDDQDS